MTQHSTRAASPPPGNSPWGRLLKRPWPVRLVLVAALLLAVPFLFHAGATVHAADNAADNEITGVTLTSPNPGELAITWDAPSRAPGDYRVTWKKSDGKWPSYKNANTVQGGNAFPTGTSHTVSDLEEGTEYSVRVRARYHDGGGNITESGPWSDPPVGLTIAGLPDKPTGLSASPGHDSVLLSWTDPGDGTVTGYQMLRGPDAANLAVLADNTGTAATSYTDSTVDAETGYAYAIRAWNSGGLGPQSDPVSATTTAAPEEAPEEAPAPEQLPMASFTLDGQALDTSGTCNENDIAAVADACTISITTRAPVFAVHGTVDSDDRMTVRTGRDSSAVSAASATADQDDLRGTDQTATLTLAEGRHLLRLWADEDTSSGGSEEHFFRVNILPNWELNDERLSKDSACRATSAPALGDITDGDCIATQAGNSGSIRFHNVTTGQFNVYVSVNGSEVVREPGDTALGGPFALALQGGENLLRVRLASKGNTHGAESYGRNAFYYKITTPSPPAKPAITSHGSGHATAFLTWADPGDDSVTGYQVLRGLAADTLAVLADDTESTDTPYTDETVEPETQYFYAIRARNAAGLSPQSDTVSTTTQAAPPEIIAERSTSGFEITLDGLTLDTDTACDEDDVASIPEGCTVNIETRSPVFAVVGTVDPDDLIAITTGRDKAAVDAASESADESGLRGDAQTVALTFPEGRSLLQVVTDEDEAAGGEETHYFRVNVVPHWELNGQRLSKDSACQSAAARTAAQITDSKCILTSFKTAEFRLHNVINQHFNVYVDVNGDRVISEPGDTALAEPFTLDLQEGENVVVIRLAAKDSQPHGETYGNNSFYHKVTGTDVLVSNLGQTRLISARGLSSAGAIATKFTTGSNTGGYTVSKVRLSMSVASASVRPVVSIYSDNSGEPDSSLVPLTNPASISVSTMTQTEVEFDAGDYKLDADTSYWIVVEKPSGSDEIYVDLTQSVSDDPGGAPDWNISNPSSALVSGAWMTLNGTTRMVLAVKGALLTLSDDASLKALAAGGATLEPAFDSSVVEYRVEVPEETATVTIEATTTDDGAEAVISPTDSDLVTPGEQVNLLPGNNRVTITVTAEDGLATTSYGLTVYRGPEAGKTGGFTQISVGGREACGLRVDGTVECFGEHVGGAGSTWSPDGVFSQIVTGRQDVCVTRPDGSLYCWRGNQTAFEYANQASQQIVTKSGAMSQDQGAGGTFGMTSTWYRCRLNANGSAVCNDGSRFVSTRTGPFKAIAVAQYFACGLLETGSLDCWGINPFSTDDVDFDVPEPDWKYKYVDGFRYQVCAIKDADDNTDGTAICWGPSFGDGGVGPDPVTSPTVAWSNTRSGPFVSLSTSIGRISNGSQQGNVCGVLEDGTVDCWGDQRDFRSLTWVSLADTLATLGTAPDEGTLKYTDVGVRRNLYVCGLREDKTIACWGEWPRAMLNNMPAFESPWKSNADLLDLQLEGASLIEAFAKNTTSYTASVEHSIDSVTLTPKLTNRIAFYSIASEQDAAIADDTIDLAVGVNLITIRVTSADRSVTKTYQLSITRTGL